MRRPVGSWLFSLSQDEREKSHRSKLVMIIATAVK
jgi:hypothetical protein